MTLKDLLKKKDKIKQDGASPTAPTPSPQPQPHPEFTFIRTTTDMHEIITPPSFPADDDPTYAPHLTVDKDKRNRFSFRKSSRDSSPPTGTSPSPAPSNDSKSDDRRLSRRFEDKLHIRSRSRSRAASTSSVHVPADLPEIEKTGAEDPEAEAEWEKRALLLAKTNERSRPGSPATGEQDVLNGDSVTAVVDGGNDTKTDNEAKRRTISAAESDVNIQEAIRLHEAGGADLERSTRMFGKLADPAGENNALAQVLYGLALRHGWGCAPDRPAAMRYLTLAASNSALVESAALDTGIAKGGAAKGELVLAIFELGNSFRHGWGCDKDPVAARKYYETAANLGDTDAMTEVAWCYLEGFGGKKDKFRAAQYLQMAEKKGVKEPGNSWIWKDKYSSAPAAGPQSSSKS